MRQAGFGKSLNEQALHAKIAVGFTQLDIVGGQVRGTGSSLCDDLLGATDVT
jgi:hypothetical protein